MEDIAPSNDGDAQAEHGDNYMANFEECSSSGYSTIDSDLSALFDAQKNTDSRVSMENFALLRVLGKGAYGKVFLVRKIGGSDSGRVYAMKVLTKTRVAQKPKTLEHTLTERQALERLKGLPFLVEMVYAFQTENKLHIVMEFIRGGELFTHLCRKKQFNTAAAQVIVAEIVVALDNIHKCNVIYRDLKLENILLDEDGHVVLTDFGLSKMFREDEISSTTSYCGTIEYMSPEIVKRGPEGYNEMVDWWSMGVITFELLTGCSPFTVDGAQNSTQEIAKRILTKSVPFPRTMDETSRDFINGLLTKDPKRRLGAGGVQEIKSHDFFAGIDWEKVQRKEVDPSIKPSLTNNIDVNNFAPEFTNQPPIFSPTDSNPGFSDIFRGYSFVSPSVIFANDNVIGEEFLNEDVRSFSQNLPFFSKYEMDVTPKGFLGRGAFSICRKCKRLSDGKEFCVKIVSQKFSYHALREIRILEMLNPHDNIVTLVDAMSDPYHFYIVLELLKGGELLQTLRKMVKFTEFQAAEIMSQLVKAVSHIHSKGVVHRDLKPENILFVDDRSPDVKIQLVDFGFARLLPNSKDSCQLATPCCGTLFYAAPEVLEIQDELPQYNQQCDLWSLGVILFTMLSGKVPFRARSNAESAADVISRIRLAEFSFDDPVWDSVNEQAKDLITGLLTVDPKKRFSLTELANHPWLTSSGINSAFELQTPTILPSTSNEVFNETISAFITANRDGFHLMDVDTAPLLVKRRGMKRRLEKSDRKLSCTTNTKQSMKLRSVPENGEFCEASHVKSAFGRPKDLDLNGVAVSSSAADPMTITPSGTPQSAAFTEYRDTKPSYLKYSRDDVPDASEDDTNAIQTTTTTAAGSMGSHSSSSSS